MGCVALCLLSSPIAGKQVDTDSLYQIYRSKIFQKYRMQEMDSFLHYALLASHLPNLHPGQQELVTKALGNGYIQQGHYQKALEAFQQSLHYSQLTNDSATLHQAYYNLGITYRHLGDYSLVLEYLFKSLEIRIHLYGLESKSVSACYNMIGVTHHDLNAYEQALDFHKKALGIRQQTYGEVHTQTAGSYNNLGLVYYELKQYSQAIRYYERSVTIKSKLSGTNHPSVAGSYLNLGACHIELGEFDRALEYLTNALNIFLQVQGPKHPNVIGAYGNIGNAYALSEQYDRALEATQQGLETASHTFQKKDPYANPDAKELLLHRYTINVLKVKGKALWKKYQTQHQLKDLQASWNTYNLGIQLLARLQEQSLSSFSQQWWKEEGIGLFEGAIDASAALYHLTQDSVWLGEAFRIAEAAKANQLYGELLDAQAKVFSSVPDSVLQDEASLRNRISKLERIIASEQQLQQADSNRLFRLHSQLLAPKDSLIQLLQQLETTHPLYHSWRSQQLPPTLPATQGTVADSSLLIEFVCGKEQLYALAISPERVEIYSIGIDSLSERIEEMHRLLKQSDKLLGEGQFATTLARLQELGYGLYETLLAPILRDHPFAAHLIIVPDNDLAYLPFDMLIHEPSSSSTYRELAFLVKKYVIRYAYSAAVRQYSTHSHASPPGNWAGFAPSIDSAVTDWPPLLHTQQELTHLQAITGGQSFFGEQATERLLKQQMTEASILHIASHAITDNVQPAFSAMIFAREKGSEEDGKLYAYEVYQSQISAQLAVLSACNTGAGPLAKGEGVMSLARAFKSAGCPNIVMSLWPVDDEATAELMKLFYSFLDSGYPKDRALQQAKCEMIQSSPYVHPHYWASFVLIGDDESIRFSAYPPALSWVWVLLLVACGLWIFYRFLSHHR